jgi:type II secretory pathway component PulM
MSGQFSEKLITFLKKLKELLSKDYSLQDLKKIKSLPKLLQEKLAQSKTANTSAASGRAVLELERLPQLALAFAIRQRNTLVILLLIGLLLVVNALVIAPYSQKVQDQLEMRPVQWSQLQSLIKQAKSAATSGQSSYSAVSNVPSTVGQLDEIELQKIRNALTARGLKPNLLRLTTDNPPRIEFQASDVMFSVLLDALDELRVTWRLYPQELKVISGSGAGLVNVSGNLLQQGSQLGASR